jgi:hypothetical protein
MHLLHVFGGVAFCREIRLEHYSCIRKEAKFRALAAICKPKSTSVAVIAKARKRGSAPLMAQKLLGVGEGNPN